VKSADQLGGYAEAVKRYHGNLSPRAKRLIELESYVKCSQYDGRPSWWVMDVPLQERAPCVVYPIVRIAVNSNTDMVLGEGRYPELTTKIAEDEADDENGLSSDQSKEVDRFLREYHRVSRFKAGAREAFDEGQGCGSVACIHGVRQGKPFQDLIPAKWCEPELDQEGAVLKIVIQYPYLEQYQDRAGDWCVRTKLYRRVIDDMKDTEFFPADAPEASNAQIDWKVNKARSVEHKLGFCPVVWYPFMRGCQPINVFDGEAIHAYLYQEIEAHDFALSMRHRASLYAGDPQWIEIGVEQGYNPTDGGRTPMMPATPQGGAPSETNPVVGGFVLGTKQARKRGSSQIYQYENPDTKVELITLPGDALDAIHNNAFDLRMKLQESMAVVFLDPENIKFAVTTSGKALAAIKQRQLDRCDQYRDDFADKFLEPSISMQLRISHTILSRGEKLRVPGGKEVKKYLDKFMVSGEWAVPSIQVIWGDYFKPDPEDQQKIISMVVSALSSPIPVLTLGLALQKIAPIFGIENIAAIQEQLEAEQAERDERALEKTTAEHAALSQIAAGINADQGGAGKPGAGKQPPPKAGRGSSGGAALPKKK